MDQLFSGWGLIWHLDRHSGSAIGMLFDAVLSVLHTNLFGRDATLHVLTLCNRSACAIAWPDFDWKEICRPIKRGRRLVNIRICRGFAVNLLFVANNRQLTDN